MADIVKESGSATTGTGSKLRIRIINEGQGSSGFYPAEVLEQAAKDKVFKAGTLMFIDHPSESENWERPERSIKDLAGALATDAVYEDGALVADANVFSTWREAIAEMKDTIGVSIRAGAEVAIEDNGGGPVQVIKRLTHAASVDYVTQAGRGGQVLEVLESARSFDLVTEAPKDSAPNPAAVHENQEEANMATIDDKELTDLRESASRATAAEADVTAAKERATAAEAALKESNDEAAAALVTSALESAGLTAPKLAARLAEGYPVKENGALNAEALAATVAESVAELQVAGGAGSVRGVGHTDPADTKTTVTAESAKADILRIAGYTPKGAK